MFKSSFLNSLRFLSPFSHLMSESKSQSKSESKTDSKLESDGRISNDLPSINVTKLLVRPQDVSFVEDSLDITIKFFIDRYFSVFLKVTFS